MNLNEEREAVADLADRAGQLVLGYFRSERIGTREKGARDVVTEADLASESFIRGELQRLFPEDEIVGEEGTSVESSSGRRWYVDPVDGTLNYSRGLPIWCVSIGVLDESGPVLGVIRDPLLKETFSAARGMGATLNGVPIAGSSVRDATQALVHLTVDFQDDTRAQGIEDLEALSPRVMRTRNIGSAALALAYVAAGYLDAMLHRSASTWDYAAGVLLVSEAGGSVTDMDGLAFSESTTSMAAASSDSLRRSLLTNIGERGGTRVQ